VRIAPFSVRIAENNKEKKTSTGIRTQIAETGNADAQWRNLCTAGGVVALIQLALVVISMAVAFTLGREPGTADGYFAMFQESRLEAILRLDFPTLIQLCLFPITAFGIYAAFQRTHRGSRP